ncbi:MAG: hypothetical protein AAFV93_22665 [Chloroflexota bacterium]
MGDTAYNEKQLRELDVNIAKALGFYFKDWALYSPTDTLMGGNSKHHGTSKIPTVDEENQIWLDYTPRFSTSMNDAMYLLEILNAWFGISYNLFLENGLVYHTCEIGHWASEAGQRDQLWTACEKKPAHAIAMAVSKCPIVMGELK